MKKLLLLLSLNSFITHVCFGMENKRSITIINRTPQSIDFNFSLNNITKKRCYLHINSLATEEQITYNLTNKSFVAKPFLKINGFSPMELDINYWEHIANNNGIITVQQFSNEILIIFSSQKKRIAFCRQRANLSGSQ